MPAKATEQRDRAFDSAASDAARAAEIARAIDDGWFRCQALAAAARYASAGAAGALVREALAAVAHERDGYRRVVPATWPLRALIERGDIAEARDLFSRILSDAESIAPNSSRAHALWALFHATYALGEETHAAVVAALSRAREEHPHWRYSRIVTFFIDRLGRDTRLGRQCLCLLPPKEADRWRRRPEQPLAPMRSYFAR